MILFSINFAYSEPNRSRLAGNHCHGLTVAVHSEKDCLKYLITWLSKATLLHCYLLHLRLYTLQFLHTASLVD